MTIYPVAPDQIEAKVGAKRHATLHIAQARSLERQFYLMHPQTEIDEGVNLLECPFTEAEEAGIDPNVWEGFEDRPVIVRVDESFFDLTPEDHPLEIEVA